MASRDATVMAGFEALPRLDLGRARREERLGIRGRSRKQLAAVSALLILGPCLLVPSTLQVIDLRRQTREADRQMATLNTQWQRVSQASDRADARIGLWTRFQQSRDSRRVWDDVLPALATTLPDEVVLQRAQITKGDSGAEFAVQGTSETVGGLRAFLKALAASPVFFRVRLEETSAVPGAGPHGVSFKIAGPLAGASTP